jgi:hypothetical protein
VEAEGELVQVVVEVLAGDAALVGAQLPAFQQRGDAMHMRQRDVGRVTARTDVDHRVAVGGLTAGVGRAVEEGIARPGVGSDLRPRCDGALDERA